MAVEVSAFPIGVRKRVRERRHAMEVTVEGVDVPENWSVEKVVEKYGIKCNKM